MAGKTCEKTLKNGSGFIMRDRPHQSLEDWTPDEIYFKKQELKRAA